MRGLIIEGIPGSGKSRLIRDLVARLASLQVGPLWVAREHVTERTLEPLRTADPRQAQTLVGTHLHLLETMAKLDQCAPVGPRTTTLVLLERFHLSLSIHIQDLKRRWFEDWDHRLADLELGLLLCVLPETEIRRYAIDETVRERNDLWQRWLATVHPDPDGQAAHFGWEQEQFQELFRLTGLKKLCLSARTSLPEENVARCAQFLGLEALPGGTGT